jgi:hypothetical protein
VKKIEMRHRNYSHQAVCNAVDNLIRGNINLSMLYDIGEMICQYVVSMDEMRN